MDKLERLGLPVVPVRLDCLALRAIQVLRAFKDFKVAKVSKALQVKLVQVVLLVQLASPGPQDLKVILAEPGGQVNYFIIYAGFA